MQSTRGDGAVAWLRLPINHVHGVDPANGQKIVLVFKDHSYQCLQYITIPYLPTSSTIPYTLPMPCTTPTSVTHNKDYSLPTSNTIPTIAIPSIGNTLPISSNHHWWHTHTYRYIYYHIVYC